MHSVNLLPLAASQRIEQKRIMAVWTKLVLLAVIGTLASISYGQSAVARHRLRIEQGKLAAEYPMRTQRLNQQLQDQLRRLRQHQAEQIELRSQFSPLVIVRMLQELKLQLGGALEVKSLDFADESDKPRGDKDKSGDKSGQTQGHVTLQLVTDSTSNSSHVLQLIKDTGYFNEVNLSSALEKLHPNAADLRFTVRCDF